MHQCPQCKSTDLVRLPSLKMMCYHCDRVFDQTETMAPEVKSCPIPKGPISKPVEPCNT